MTCDITSENYRGVDQLEQWLQEQCHTPCGPYLRPFAPNPNWKKATVFIVGTNPATPLRTEFSSFDHYWTALTHDKAAFDTIYLSKRDGKASKTSTRAILFEQSLGELGVLRCNACALPSRRWKDLSKEAKLQSLKQGRQVLRALIRVCQPQAILGHGQPAIESLSMLYSIPLDPYEPLVQQNNMASLKGDSPVTQVFAYPHLSGLGVKKGFAVSNMDNDLTALAQRLNQGTTLTNH